MMLCRLASAPADVLGRASLAAQLDQELGDLVDCDRGDARSGEHRQQVRRKLIAVGLQGARAAFAGGDLRLKTLEPPAGDGIKAKPWRDRLDVPTRGVDQREAFAARELEVEADGAKPQPAGVVAADRVLPVGLPVDAALHANAAISAARRSHVFLLDRMGLHTLASPTPPPDEAAGRLTRS